MKPLQDIYADKKGHPFLIGAELVTTRGSAEQPAGHKVQTLADDLSKWGRCDWISITDNAGGHPMLAPAVLGKAVQENGTNVIVHLTCKDRNRNAIESVAWQLASEGLDNILVLTGDFPGEGYHGTGAPVFDLDSCTLTRMLADMNAGLQVPGRKPGSMTKLDRTNFHLGCAVSPFKTNEAELMCQYLKLGLKVANGSQFVIPQLGYDMRKSHELMLYMAHHGMRLPVFGNIYILTKTVARIFNQKKIPGCTVSDSLLAEIEKYASGPDKGKSYLRELAAKQLACFKGIGYRGAYFGGFAKAETIQEIVALADTYSEDDWKVFARDVIWPMEEDFYLFEQDEETGLANPDQDSPEVIASRNKVDETVVSTFYHLNRYVHATVFEPTGLLHKPVRKLYETVLNEDKHPSLHRVAKWQEKVIKTALYNCQDCGDCSLNDCGFFCPGASCKKNMRNGPCGGSRGILCESGDFPCIWYRSYFRAKADGQLDSFLKRDLILRNQALKGTSSWANYFLGKDHSSHLLEASDESDDTPHTDVTDNQDRRSACNETATVVT